jgi:hypothetical protein
MPVHRSPVCRFDVSAHPRSRPRRTFLSSSTDPRVSPVPHSHCVCSTATRSDAAGAGRSRPRVRPTGRPLRAERRFGESVPASSRPEPHAICVHRSQRTAYHPLRPNRGRSRSPGHPVERDAYTAAGFVRSQRFPDGWRVKVKDPRTERIYAGGRDRCSRGSPLQASCRYSADPIRARRPAGPAPEGPALACHGPVSGYAPSASPGWLTSGLTC